tara:strand:- start:207 stop:533 length:327 start_codon:yes stop_codon:yes gene_type:complete
MSESESSEETKVEIKVKLGWNWAMINGEMYKKVPMRNKTTKSLGVCNNPWVSSTESSEEENEEDEESEKAGGKSETTNEYEYEYGKCDVCGREIHEFSQRCRTCAWRY